MFDAYFPPPAYDIPFPGEIRVIEVPAFIASEYCPQHGVACVISLDRGHCTVIFNTDYARQREAIMRHERGHCNGWPESHPNAQPR